MLLSSHFIFLIVNGTRKSCQWFGASSVPSVCTLWTVWVRALRLQVPGNQLSLAGGVGSSGDFSNQESHGRVGHRHTGPKVSMIFSGSLALPLSGLFPSVCWLIFQAASVLRERKGHGQPQAHVLIAYDIKGRGTPSPRLQTPNLIKVSDCFVRVMAPSILSGPTLCSGRSNAVISQAWLSPWPERARHGQCHGVEWARCHQTKTTCPLCFIYSPSEP